MNLNSLLSSLFKYLFASFIMDKFFKQFNFPRDLNYEQHHQGFDTETGVFGVQCKNFLICGSTLPNGLFKHKAMPSDIINNKAIAELFIPGTLVDPYVCAKCHIYFADWSDDKFSYNKKEVLPLHSNSICSKCNTLTDCAERPLCNHLLCFQCITECYFNKEPPTFPYPDIFNDFRKNPQKYSYQQYPKLEEFNKKLYKHYEYLQTHSNICHICNT